MGFNNPRMPWAEFNRRLSDIRPDSDKPANADGGDSPAWSNSRSAYVPHTSVEPMAGERVPYAELHCHSNFSFLDGASHPEELAEEAVRLGLEALALTDHDGFYGVVRFAEAADALGLSTVFGSELTLAAESEITGVPDPGGTHLLFLAKNPKGYASLARCISTAQMAGSKGKPDASLDQMGSFATDDWYVLTGCRKGLVAKALQTAGIQAASAALGELGERFGRGNVLVELWDHGDPGDDERNEMLFDLATRAGFQAVATNNVHYASPRQVRLAQTVSAIRSRRSLTDISGWLPVSGLAHLRSGVEQRRRFERFAGVVDLAAEVGRSAAFQLKLVSPNLPKFPVPDNHTEMTWLRVLTEEGAARCYGPRNKPMHPNAYKQIDYELDVIEQLDFPGYFLIVWDIVEFCRRSNIYCQGRGSAANSAVCYSLGITKADAVRLGLLFDRFLAPERDGPPDIDLDIESGRREEVIQYVYRRYGRKNAAQVANVITYRPKMAVRDAARAYGYDPGRIDMWSKQMEGWGPVSEAVGGSDHDIPEEVIATATQLDSFPRHLGIHSGGMVICDRPVSEVCPVEWARMKDRSVLQWDKDDCAATGLVKFDLLGLGMLEVLHDAVDLIREHHGIDVDLATLPQDPDVYQMLCKADTVGVFQVESRAQMATLPRLKPREFYDLVVEVALIRPGPIQGGSVHPYIRRRNGQEKVTYLHPLLKPSLEKTLGVPLFQEQLMQMAIDVAGFTPAEADQLRQAMGSKRSNERMERLRKRLYDGMAERGITGSIADQIFEKLAAFASFGFPESHSVSFAYLVYSSAYLKFHYPAEFLAALLNAQPMGFWSPATLIADARRHGVVVLRPDVNHSRAKAFVEDGGATRLGLSSVRCVGEELAESIASSQPFSSMNDFARKTAASRQAIEALATAGAFESLGMDRRRALWAAGAMSQARDDRLDGVVIGGDAPALPEMTREELVFADYWATSATPDGHLIQFLRGELDRKGVSKAEDLQSLRDGQMVTIGGIVTHRQRPATAQGITFLSIEDETGLMNVVCSMDIWTRFRRVARTSAALLVYGKLESAEGVINIVAHHLKVLPVGADVRSRDFH